MEGHSSVKLLLATHFPKLCQVHKLVKQVQSLEARARLLGLRTILATFDPQKNAPGFAVVCRHPFRPDLRGTQTCQKAANLWVPCQLAEHFGMLRGSLRGDVRVALVVCLTKCAVASAHDLPQIWVELVRQGARFFGWCNPLQGPRDLLDVIKITLVEADVDGRPAPDTPSGFPMFPTCKHHPKRKLAFNQQPKGESLAQNPVLKWSTQNHASRIKKAVFRRCLWLGSSLANLRTRPRPSVRPANLRPSVPHVVRAARRCQLLPQTCSGSHVRKWPETGGLKR